MGRLSFLGCVWAGALGLVALSGWPEEEPFTDDELVIKIEKGHRLLLPKDWPIEERDGHLSPIPIEEYLSMKFDGVAEALRQTTKRLETLEQRIKELEQDNKALQRRLRLLEEDRQ